MTPNTEPEACGKEDARQQYHHLHQQDEVDRCHRTLRVYPLQQFDQLLVGIE
jgi:hypothetical protein